MTFLLLPWPPPAVGLDWCEGEDRWAEEEAVFSRPPLECLQWGVGVCVRKCPHK